MAAFRCKTVDATGSTVTKVIEATSSRAAMLTLQNEGLTPIRITETKTPAPAPAPAAGAPAARRGISFGGGVKKKELMAFTLQLGSTISAGVPILSGLQSIQQQTPNERFKSILAQVAVDIEGGLPMSQALAHHPKVFPEVYINTIAAGEKSGSLEDVLENLSEFLEAELEIRSDVRSALMYPAIVIATLCLALSVLIIFVVPKFATFYSQFGQELPLPTRIMITGSTILADYFVLMLVSGVALLIGVTQLIRTPKGKRVTEQILLRTPVIGRAIQTAVTLRTVQMLGLFTRAGVPVLEGLETIAAASAGVEMKEKLSAVAEGVANGESLASSLEEANCFQPTVRQMIAGGEATGSLERACTTISVQYKKELRYQTKNLATFIEPLMTLVLAGVVLFVALATFLPMWDLVKLARN